MEERQLQEGAVGGLGLAAMGSEAAERPKALGVVRAGEHAGDDRGGGLAGEFLL